jgi:hypothetical protein
MAASRAIREFRSDRDLWKTLDSWARETGYRLVESAEGRGLYQKGIGILVAPMKVEVRTNGDLIHLEAWVHIPFITRLISLFILPDEMTIESGGVRAILPRQMARTAVNRLLAMLNQPPIP